MDCIFCKIANGEIPSIKVFENEKIVAFNDINPKANIHVLIVPKKHIESIKHLEEADKELVGEMFLVAQKIAKEKNLIQSNDEGALKAIVEKAIRENPEVVATYKAGKENAIMSLVGKIIKESNGSANPQIVIKLLKEML